MSGCVGGWVSGWLGSWVSGSVGGQNDHVAHQCFCQNGTMFHTSATVKMTTSSPMLLLE